MTKIGKILLETFGAIVLGLIVLMLVLAWRLSEGPISLSFAENIFANYYQPKHKQFQFALHEPALKWERFKFNAAHFIAYDGFRERLHGHNYHVGVKIKGDAIGSDGYVVDFGDVKKVVIKCCKALNERFICPAKSDVLQCKMKKDAHGILSGLKLTCQDGCKFLFPAGDCVILPIVHSSAEELARYLSDKICEEFTTEFFASRNARLMEVSVSEAPNQTAIYRKWLS